MDTLLCHEATGIEVKRHNWRVVTWPWQHGGCNSLCILFWDYQYFNIKT